MSAPCSQRDSKPDYFYTCLELPTRYITKPVGHWMCMSCAKPLISKRTHEFNNRVEKHFEELKTDG